MKKTIALIGSPNCGKTSLFNLLTGLNQKVGNFAGVTVDRKTGFWEGEQATYSVVDLPGTYSLHPKSPEEEIVVEYLINTKEEDLPDAVLVVIDQTNLRRNLLLFSQVADLGLPVVAVLNMSDLALKRGVQINLAKFEKLTGAKAISINARTGERINELENLINQASKSNVIFCDDRGKYLETLEKHHSHDENKAYLKEEVLTRFKKIDEILGEVLIKHDKKTLVDSFDKVLLHPFFGYVIFFGVLFLIFQLLFTISSYPMDVIDSTFSFLQEWVKVTFGFSSWAYLKRVGTWLVSSF